MAQSNECEIRERRRMANTSLARSETVLGVGVDGGRTTDCPVTEFQVPILTDFGAAEDNWAF